MATNVTERNKTLQEIIEWCENSRSTLVKFLQQTHLLGIVGTTSCNGRIRAYEDVINHCKDMLGSGSMPSEVSNQSDDANIEKLLNEGWKILRVDTMPPTELRDTAVTATNVYILEREANDD